MSSQRTRNFSTVVYPESVREDWLRRLDDQHIEAFVSPLHSEDVNPDRMQNGEFEKKKPHYHVVLMFQGVKTRDQVKELLDYICGSGYAGIEIIQSIRGYARYLCHLDNPEKYQYDTSQVMSFGGADYFGIIGLPIDKYTVVGDMMDFCNNEDIYSLAKLCFYAKAYRPDWYRSLCDNSAFIMSQFLKSLYWDKTNVDFSLDD